MYIYIHMHYIYIYTYTDTIGFASFVSFRFLDQRWLFWGSTYDVRSSEKWTWGWNIQGTLLEKLK